jgi:hypothetical protein
LSFTSNYTLNRLLDKLPPAGPKWRCKVKTIVGDVIGPDGKPVTEDVEIWVRDVMDLVREILGNPAYGKQLVFAPRRVYLDKDKKERKIDEMWTADWWWKIQVSMNPL